MYQQTQEEKYPRATIMFRLLHRQYESFERLCDKKKKSGAMREFLAQNEELLSDIPVLKIEEAVKLAIKTHEALTYPPISKILKCAQEVRVVQANKGIPSPGPHRAFKSSQEDEYTKALLAGNWDEMKRIRKLIAAEHMRKMNAC